jgi:phage-related protein
MRNVEFYRTINGQCPVEDYLDTLNDKQVEKILWVLKVVKELHIVPQNYLKKLVSTDDIWEIRVRSGNNIFRLLGFFHSGALIILTNGFTKKTQTTPKNEIEIAEKRKKEYLERRRNKNG